jgi:hypothetical protein
LSGAEAEAAGAAAPSPSEPGEDIGKCARVDILESSRRALCARAAAKTFKALEAGLAFGVDLAPIELGALLLVAQNFVGRIDLRKLGLRLRVAAMAVGMVLLGELAIGALDLSLARGAAESQNIIGVAHLGASGLDVERTAEIW